MASRLYFGASPGGHAMRVMKDAAHDPASTPRAEYEKFAFDSESGDLGYALGINADAATVSYYPMISSMARFEADWWDMQSAFRHAPGGEGLFVQATSHRGSVTPAKVESVQKMSTWRLTELAPTPVETRYMLWQFHSENNVSEFPTGVGSLSRVFITGSQIRVPRPGYAVTDNNPNNFILRENLRPAKVIAAGRFFLGAFATNTITLPNNVPSTCFVGGQFSPNGFDVLLPMTVETGYAGSDVEEYRCQFRFLSANQIQFRERAGRPILVTYYVVAEDTAGTTSGSGPVLTRIGGGHFQIRRPGASTSPNFADILIDSRWQTMPIIAAGFVPKAAFSGAIPTGILAGQRTATASFTSPGYIPLVLVNWYLPMEFANFEGATQFVIDGSFGPPGGFSGFSGFTCYTKVQAGLLTFVNYFDRPVSYSEGAFRFWSDPYGPPGTVWGLFQGVRYVVLGVPQS